jgi:type I restriction enzyme M protein
MTESSLISKVWNFANVLRDDGVVYGDYLEQITYLLYLKMADELTRPPYNKKIAFPRIKHNVGNEIENGYFCNWETSSIKCGTEYEACRKEADWEFAEQLLERIKKD